MREWEDGAGKEVPQGMWVVWLFGREWRVCGHKLRHDKVGCVWGQR